VRKAAHDMAHRLELLLAALQAAAEIGNRALDVLEIEPDFPAHLTVFLELHPPVLPDLLGKTLVDGGQRFVTWAMRWCATSL